ncbi:MAG: formylglycine-generating enzyme required for sulfatase activity/serine/threonine protein kinase [Lentimonas sp.]|jgi:formylglycine-generating enzyme required for sulfatase activity/serine/threonine protein kinase
MDNEDTQSGSASADSKQERLEKRLLKPGENFGNFRVVRCVGSSLLADYYQMQHVRDLHDVTVCILHPRTMEDTKFFKRLEGLQAAIRTIDLEGIPMIQDCAELNDRHCIFMDSVQGKSLSEYFAEHAQPGEVGIGVEETTLIVARLLGLLGYAHAQGVDHRDMDTDLIFIKADGSIQILGMGVKATLGSELFESIVSASVCPLVANEAPARIDSFDVMSPEYRSGIAEDSRVDIFASGYIAYWLLTGLKVDLSQYKAPSALVQDLPQGWDTLLEKALKRSSEDRYQTCKSVLLDLKETEKEIESVGAGLIQRQIDCIHVPKGIVARGELATRIYRLSVIGLIGVTVTALAASFLHSLFKEEPSAPSAIVVATDGATPNFSMSLKPVESQVRFVGVAGVFRAKSGKLDLVVQPGDYDVSITAPQYVEQQLSVTVGEVALPAIDVELEEAFTDLEIQTNAGASIVMLNEEGLGMELGMTGAEGRFTLKRGEFSGAYRIVIRKVGYSPLIVEDLSGELVEAALVELPSGLTVRTQPTGARVLVNDVEVGRSPVAIDAPAGSGSYLVVVTRDGYRSVERRIQLDRGEYELVDFGELVGCSAALDFSVTFTQTPQRDVASLMGDLKVALDGQQLQLDAAQLQVVPEGAHAVQLLHPVYTSELRSVTVADREDQTLTYVMSPLPGWVELALPKGLEVDVHVNTKNIDVVEDEIPVAVNQRVEVELRIKDNLTMVRRFKLKPNERVVWDVTPVPIPGPEFGSGWTLPYIVLKLSWIEAGQFSMGSPIQESGRLPNEGPQAQVRLSQGFWAGMYEVTRAQYYKVMEQNPASVTAASLPVDNVTWEDAHEYCQVLTNQEQAVGRLPGGYVYRLPTEAEWEYLARAGSVTPFGFGDRADASAGNFQGVYPGNVRHEARVSDHYGSLPVGSYAPNAFGLHDTHGNVAEWTLDRYSGRLSGGSHVDPRPRDTGSRVVVRGGSWEDFAVRVRCAARDEIRDDTKSNAIGFRVVLAPRF